MALLNDMKIELSDSVRTMVWEQEKEGNTTMIASFNGGVAGVITLKDVPRTEAYQAIEQIRRHDIKHMVMLTGDNQRVADSIAKVLGIPEARGSRFRRKRLLK